MDTSDWPRFNHPEGLFSLSYPPHWSRVERRGAALSCEADDGSVLLQVKCFEQGDGAPSRARLVDVIADGLAENAPHEDGRSQGRVIARNAFGFGGAERTVDVLVAYRDGRETNQEISVDYFVTGTGRKALYVALKTPTPLFAANLPAFEQVLGSLRTPWLQASGPPNLSGGGRPRASASAGRTMSPEIAAKLAGGPGLGLGAQTLLGALFLLALAGGIIWLLRG